MVADILLLGSGEQDYQSQQLNLVHTIINAKMVRLFTLSIASIALLLFPYGYKNICQHAVQTTVKATLLPYKAFQTD